MHSSGHSPNGHSYRSIVDFSAEFEFFLPPPDLRALGDRTAEDEEDATRDVVATDDDRWFDLFEWRELSERVE